MVLINPDEGKSDSGTASGDDATYRVKSPKRILHFSDGVLEEYSTDEDEADNTPKADLVDPATLAWGPWMWYRTWSAGSGTLAVLDSVGEYLAAFFGITTPKYYFELEEYKKREAEAAAEKAEYQGWTESPQTGVQLTEMRASQPEPVDV